MSPLLLVPGPLKKAAVKARKRLYGLGLIVVVGGLILLAILVFNKTFTPATMVVLEANQIGNQLSKGGDVKLRGLIVGSIRGVEADGGIARIDIALDPEQTDLIPQNVLAQILPKTLFGQKFVSLVIPPQPSSETISEGDVIPQDRTVTALETDDVFADFLPLLEAVQPAKLNAFLSAFATAVNGRGEQLGENFELVDTYLQGLEPSYPDLAENLRLLPGFTDTYADAAPSLLEFLDNTSATMRTFVDQEAQLNTFLTGTTEAIGTVDAFLRENEARLISVPANQRPFLEVTAKYSAAFPCFFAGLQIQEPRIQASFGGNPGLAFKGLHITLELVEDRPGYTQEDKPVYAEQSGPFCFGLPNPNTPQKSVDFADGFQDGQEGSGKSPEEANEDLQNRDGDPSTQGRALPFGAALASGPAGTQAEQDVVAGVLAPVLGVPYEEVPDIATLLFGPAARGTTVTLDVPQAGGSQP